MSPKEIKNIIEIGKLEGYVVIAGFLDIYWKTPYLSERTYWLFKFSSMEGKLISVKKTTPSFGAYGKYQAKRYVPMIQKLMKSQLKAINKIID